MPDRDDVLSANEDFYRAFEACDLDAMTAVWAGTSEDVCVHPGWEICRGPRAVRESWARIFGSGERLRILLAETSVDLVGEVARVTAVENIWLPDRRTHVGRVACTNVFRRMEGRWRMVTHHGSPIAGRGPMAAGEEQ